ncbi:MAG: methyl-accepting chemotaxis protein [Bacillota bacterium]|jgi:methyl-accepting chemotaxis protein
MRNLTLTLKKKLILAFVLVLGITGLVIFLMVNANTKKVIINGLIEQLKVSQKLGNSLLDAKYPGNWAIRDGMLYKGDMLINGNFEVVDEIKKQTGAVATVFMGDTRVSTNVVKDDGTRAVGTLVAPEVAERVLRSGLEYQGEADVVGKKYQSVYSPIRDANGNVIGIWFVGVEKSVLNQEIRFLNFYMMWMVLVILAAGVGISVILANSILKAVPPLIEGIGRAANGDLTVNVPVMTEDEIGQITDKFNKMVQEQNKSLRKVLQSAENVENAVKDINSGNQDLSQRTQEQASTLEEIASTIEEVTASIRQTAENSEQADQISQTTLAVVQDGEKVVEETMEAMQQITGSSKQIADIIKVVNDIAFQTNLLALNAAVEAARAGEQGRGFAVVAAEVRNLASRTAESSREIEKLIKESVQRVENGNALVQRSGEVLRQIVENTRRASDMVLEITATMKEQAEASQQIQNAIEQLNQVTQQNAAMVEEIAASGEALGAEAENLMEIVSSFKIGEKVGEPKNKKKERSGEGQGTFSQLKQEKNLGFQEDSLEQF